MKYLKKLYVVHFLPGCTSLGTYLPDMWNQCDYRDCVYGPRPWINHNGELSIHDLNSPCPAGEAVPLGFVSSESIPCQPMNVYCLSKSRKRIVILIFLEYPRKSICLLLYHIIRLLYIFYDGCCCLLTLWKRLT